MLCRDCGAQITADSKFCKDCGSKQEAGARTMALVIEDLEPVKDVSKERLNKLLEMAFWHYDVGNLTSAVRACEAALAINPASASAHSLMATISEKQGNDERAMEHLEAILLLNPNSDADRHKLKQLKRGVHLKSAEAPAGYRWIPPALSGLARPGARTKVKTLMGGKVGKVRVAPLAFSAVAAVIVLVIGLALPQRQPVPATITPQQSASYRVPVVETTSVNTAERAVPPLTIGPRVTNSLEPTFAQTPDPFAGPAGRAAAKSDNSDDDVPVAPVLPHRGTPLNPLPELKAVPPTDDDLQPAPVAVDTPPLATSADIPRHTVVVSQLGSGTGDVTAPAPAAEPQPAVAPAASSDNGPTSVIHITVHNNPDASDSDSAQPGAAGTTSSVDESTPPTVSMHNDEAQAYQQYALSLQEQGDYRGAKTAYERAIRTYNERVRSGGNSPDARRGLQACQTGLQICEQSL
ncbi:MAG: tetratricopeptide repeat protein [Capsulimonadaceae bacterium]